jgi:hypothetical protein
MKWVVDSSGRFPWRPYYEEVELDAECERMVSDFLETKYGKVQFPISTDDLAVMVERDTSDLDLYADLSHEGEDIEGLTDFFVRKKPAVKIERTLSIENSKTQRLRTTLAHEYGHVRFHRFLWDTTLPNPTQISLAEKLSKQRQQLQRVRSNMVSMNGYVNNKVTFSPKPKLKHKHMNNGPRCRRTSIFDAPVFDWMEWQACYAGGAILMPFSSLRVLIKSWMNTLTDNVPLPPDSPPAVSFTACVAKDFDVSPEAARIRLIRLGILQPPEPNR